MNNPQDQPPRRRVAVLGGGIAGLAAALRLEEAGSDWTLYEAAPRLGGVLETVEVAGYRLELSADSFLTRDPWATDLCERVGLADDLLPTDPARRQALVVSRGQVRPVPQGFVLMSPQRAWPILASPILSGAGKARLATEWLVPRRREKSDESVADFVTRRLGSETFERLVQPLVAGIYTADPAKLSMRATMSQFVDQEQTHGSLTRAALARRRSTSVKPQSESGARYGMFVAPRHGMQQLVDTIASRLPVSRVRLEWPINRVERREPGGWRLHSRGEHPPQDADELIVTLPAYAAGHVLRDAEPTLADRLDRIEYAGCSVVCFGTDASPVTDDFHGFGFVVPAVENRRIIAASFASHKFPGRAREGGVLVRVFLGGALQPELNELTDDELVTIAREELRSLIGLTGEPHFARVARWPRRMPQYHVGHVELVEEIEQLAATAGVGLAGAAYRGVGVPQCIRSGEAAAARVLERKK